MPRTLVTQLSSAALLDGQWIDGLLAGTFDNGWLEIEIDPEDLPLYVANTKAALAATKMADGEVRGFSINIGHDYGEAAGWITDVRLSDEGVIQLKPKWTEMGREALEKGKYGYFSAEFNIKKKVLTGGALTNNPATRDENEHILLRPVELSRKGVGERMVERFTASIASLTDRIKALEGPEGESMTKKSKVQLSDLSEADVAILRAQLAAEGDDGEGEGDDEDDGAEQAELQRILKSPNGVAELASLVDKRVAVARKVEKRKAHVMNFAAELTQGTAESPFGAPVSAGEVVTVLLSLPDKQSLAVEDLLRRMWGNVIEFAERGYDVTNFIKGKQLPAEIAKLAKNWVDGGGDIMEFMRTNEDVLGDARDYNLAPYTLSKKED